MALSWGRPWGRSPDLPWVGSFLITILVACATSVVSRSTFASDCGFLEDYGEGCPGSTVTPSLRVVAPCLAPLAPLTIELATGPGEKLAFLVAGAAHFTIAVTPGCSLQVGEFFPWLIPVAIPAEGRTSISGVLPRDSAFAEIFLQAVVVDPAAPFSVSATNPIGIYVGA